MDALRLVDVRSFSGLQTMELRPLTILIGENSTGKTTALAAVRIAYDLLSGQPGDFNEAPFLLGSYHDVANFRGGRAGRARSFSIGGSFPGNPRVSTRGARSRSGQIAIRGSYVDSRAGPHLAGLSIGRGPVAI